MITARLVLVTIPTGLPTGVLAAPAWDALRAVDAVVTTAPGGWRAALEDIWCEVLDIRPDAEAPALTGALAGIARVGRGAWLLPAEDIARARSVAERALRLADADVDDLALVPGAPVGPDEPRETPGPAATPAPSPARSRALAELERSIEIMDALRSRGGDAWSAEQTHASLTRYLLEEALEVIEVIEGMPAGPARDRALADELGDVWFQVLFHARIGEEAVEPWSLADVASAFNRKMERRNPHVFGSEAGSEDGPGDDVAAIIAQWHAAKRAEGRDGGLFAGIPRALPALQRAAKVVHRARSAGRLDELLADADAVADEMLDGEAERPGAAEARELLDLVDVLERRDIDLESALRTLLESLAARAGQAAADPDPGPEGP